jgi:hypothetical protein
MFIIRNKATFLWTLIFFCGPPKDKPCFFFTQFSFWVWHHWRTGYMRMWVGLFGKFLDRTHIISKMVYSCVGDTKDEHLQNINTNLFQNSTRYNWFMRILYWWWSIEYCRSRLNMMIIDWLNIYFGRLCHHQEVQSTVIYKYVMQVWL